GATIFRQEDVEVPKTWSQTATNIVASKYFHGKMGTPDRESSVRQLISCVANTIVRWGNEGGYFADAASREAFRDELTHLLVEQKMAFNSPVWFNVGVQAKPQCSACFINSVRDDMGSIMDLAKTKPMCSSNRATTARLTARPTAPSSSRTPTTPCASPTTSCAPWSRTRIGGPRTSTMGNPSKSSVHAT